MRPHLGLLFVLALWPGIMAAGDTSVTNVQILIVDVQWTIYDGGSAAGYGHGNVRAIDGLNNPIDEWRGFIFTAECGSRFLPSESKDDTADGYWKKEGTRLIMLLQQIGGNKVSKCELKTSMRDDAMVYTRPGFVFAKK